MLDDIKYTTKFIDFKDSMFHFIVTINGQSFDYRLGSGHCTRLNNDKTSIQFNITQLDKADRITICKSIYGYYKKISLWDFEDLKTVYVKRPEIKDVLHCLFLDSSARNQCFKDWCSEFGYSDDSIKVKSTYESCLENAFKLKKALGDKYLETKQYIEELEL